MKCSQKEITEIGLLYESTLTEDYDPIYHKVLIEEGLLRRIGNKIASGLSRPALKNVNKQHEFAKSVAYEVANDITKVFGGDKTIHTQGLYHYILKYLKNLHP